MSITEPQSRFLVSPEYALPGGGSMVPGRGTAAASSGRVDEDMRPAGVTAAATPAGEELGFADLLDVINPLQHIPVVGDLYRSLTGDTIAPAARIAGGTLYGGAIGFVASLGNAMVEEVSGHDIGEHVLAMFDDSDGDSLPQVATNRAGTTVSGAPSAAALAQIAPAAGSAPASSALPAAASASASGTAAAAAPVGAEQLSSLPFLNPNREVPQLSSAAFEALVNGFGRKPVPAPEAAAPVATGNNSGVPQISMDVHNLLKGFAQRNGAASGS